ncbi:hypothetical protein GCM10008922_00680 [Faecalicatena contorta]|uniref:hypothetical protein n=1 Tax=Faecalicatena contorta TaxID=39482 RepID=UPI0031D49AFC
MAKVGRIYTESYSKTYDAISADNELTEIIETEIISKMKSHENMTMEYITDLIFAGSSCGQKCGFESGFKYAMSLIFESLIS